MIKRKTDETKVELVCVDAGTFPLHLNIITGVPMFDHLLSQMAKHGNFNLQVTAKGSNTHHIVEDVGICLGQELAKMKKGRVGYSIVPMDDALAMVAVDFSGRGYSNIRFCDELALIFLEALAREGRFNLHAVAIYGENDHHISEAIFKALGRALRAGIEDEH